MCLYFLSLLRTTVGIGRMNPPIVLPSPVCLVNSSVVTDTAFIRHCSVMANQIVAMALMKSNVRRTPVLVPSSSAEAMERYRIVALIRISDVTIMLIVHWVKTKKTAHP